MKAVVQRVTEARVEVDGRVVGELPAPGLLVLVGVGLDDTVEQAQAVARKIASLRILPDERSALDLTAPILVISQFTLYGDTRKGRRPSWSAAAPGPVAEPLVAEVAATLRALGLYVATGVFGAQMQVTSTNDGPFTILLET